LEWVTQSKLSFHIDNEAVRFRTISSREKCEDGSVSGRGRLPQVVDKRLKVTITQHVYPPFMLEMDESSSILIALHKE
jgi:hypothetical protein